MYINEILQYKQRQYFVGFIPDYDPYKTGARQCCGRCPRQKFNIIRK